MKHTMKHTMKSVMEAVEAARTEGNQRLPILTSNQCHALAEKLNAGHQGEPVAWCQPHWSGKYADYCWGSERPNSPCPESWKPLYTHADPAEVERLREELDGYKQGSRIEAEEADTLRAQLAEAHALLRDAHEELVCRNSPVAKRIAEALSASAEPSALKCCVPTAEEKALLASGLYRPEELWGGRRPTCPKCIGRG